MCVGFITSTFLNGVQIPFKIDWKLCEKIPAEVFAFFIPATLIQVKVN